MGLAFLFMSAVSQYFIQKQQWKDHQDPGLWHVAHYYFINFVLGLSPPMSEAPICYNNINMNSWKLSNLLITLRHFWSKWSCSQQQFNAYKLCSKTKWLLKRFQNSLNRKRSGAKYFYWLCLDKAVGEIIKKYPNPISSSN